MSINHTNLADSPEYIEQTLQLIESSFGYASGNSFNIDFYPLFNKDNFKHCHILIQDNQVVAHVGVKTRKLAGSLINMYGGIAVTKNLRGKGVFKSFFNSILLKYKSCALHCLWSNKIDLYKKFEFYPAIGLNEYSKKESSHNFRVEKISWDQFENESLYHNLSELRLERSKEEWAELKKIVSTNIYLLKKNNHIVNYFIKDKGADLEGVIFEYGEMSLEYLNCMRNFGRVWTPHPYPDSLSIYSTLLKLGDENLVKKFFNKSYQINISQITDHCVEFEFEDLKTQLPIADFLTGTLGPTPFEEFGKHKPIFISGLDSI